MMGLGMQLPNPSPTPGGGGPVPAEGRLIRAPRALKPEIHRCRIPGRLHRWLHGVRDFEDGWQCAECGKIWLFDQNRGCPACGGDGGHLVDCPNR